MMTTVSGALREALKRVMREDDRVFLMGEDIAEYGGIYNVTRGLVNEFGRERVIDTPMAEITIVGAGIGAAVSGMRPVVEIMYADFLPIATDQIVNNAAKFYFLSGQKTPVPLVVRTNFGSGKAEGALQSQTPEAWYMNVPGLKVVMPSDPQDAYGLMIGAIRDNNPVLFFEHKMLYAAKGDLDTGAALPELGTAATKRPGRDVTVAACGLMLRNCLEAAERLDKMGVSLEVIDLRTLKPLDTAAVCGSVKRTGRLVVVEESPQTGGSGLQLVEAAVSECFRDLKTPPKRIASIDAPLPAASSLEAAAVPSVDRVVGEIASLLGKKQSP